MAFEVPQLFLREGRVIEVQPEQPVISRGDSPKDVYLVLSGLVILHSSSVLGREFVIEVLKEGEMFGTASLLGRPAHYLDAIALTPSRVAAIDAGNLERAMLREPELAMQVLRHFIDWLQRRTTQVEDFALLSFGGRLAKLLIGIAKDQGVKLENDATFRCEYSQTLIARMVGVSRETVSRQLQKWEDSGILSHAGKTITVLDAQQLQRLSEGFPETDQ
jgi:CRP-like cAMP-binding protein